MFGTRLRVVLACASALAVVLLAAGTAAADVAGTPMRWYPDLPVAPTALGWVLEVLTALLPL